MRKTVLSGRLVRSHAALIEKTLMEVNAAAGFPPKSSYIYRVFGSDKVQLSTINRVARALGVRACDILEEVEEENPESNE